MPDWTGIALGFDSLHGQGPWLIFLLLVYPFLVGFLVATPCCAGAGWLFQSLCMTFITAAVTMWLWPLLAGCSTLLMRFGLHRRVQFFWISTLPCWALLVRLGLRKVCCSPRFRVCFCLQG